MATTTRLAIKQRMLRVLRSRDPAVANLPVPIATTSVGLTTRVNSTTLERGNPPTTRYNGRAVEIAELVASGPAVGEIAYVNDGGYDGTDALTVSPAFTAAVQSGTDVHLYPEGFSPDIVNEAINNILEATYAPFIYIPSLVVDADFDANDVGTTGAWSSVGLVDTKELVTVTSVLLRTDNQLLMGQLGLHIVADDDEGVQTLAMFVHDTEQLLISVTLRMLTATTMELEFYNSTTSAVIKTVSFNENAFTELRFNEAVPNDAESVSLRFMGTGADTEFMVSPAVIVQSDAERLYPLPSWFQSESYFKEAFYMPQGWSTDASDSYIAMSERLRPARRPEFVRGDRWATQHYVRLACPGSYPIGLLCQKPFATVSSDSTTIPADRDYVAFKAIARILRERNDAGFVQFERDADALARSLEYNEQNVTIEPPALVRR